MPEKDLRPLENGPTLIPFSPPSGPCGLGVSWVDPLPVHLSVFLPCRAAPLPGFPPVCESACLLVSPPNCPAVLLLVCLRPSVGQASLVCACLSGCPSACPSDCLTLLLVCVCLSLLCLPACLCPILTGPTEFQRQRGRKCWPKSGPPRLPGATGEAEEGNSLSPYAPGGSLDFVQRLQPG